MVMDGDLPTMKVDKSHTSWYYFAEERRPLKDTIQADGCIFVSGQHKC